MQLRNFWLERLDFRERTNCKKWLDPVKLTIKSPNYPFEYGNNVRCGWDITAKPGFDVWLRIVDFNVSRTKKLTFAEATQYLSFYVFP